MTKKSSDIGAEFFEQGMHAVPFGLVWFTERGRVLKANRWLTDLLGYEQEEMEDLSVFELDPATSRLSWKAHWKTVQSGGVSEIETQLMQCDDQMTEVYISAHALTLPSGPCCCWTISKSKSDSSVQQLLETTISYLNSGGFELDLESKRVLATDTFYELLGMEERGVMEGEQLIQKISQLHFDKTEMQELNEKNRMAIVEGIPCNMRLKLTLPDKSTRWLIYSGYPIRKNGRTVKFYGTLSDHTQTHNLNRDSYLAKVSLDQAVEMVFWIKPNGQIYYANESAGINLEYAQTDLPAMYIWEINPTIEPNKWGQQWQHLKNALTDSYETSFRTNDGTVFPILLSLNYIEFDDEAYVSAIARNITSRQIRENQLTEAYEEVADLKERLQAEVEYLQEEISTNNLGEIISRSPRYKKVLEQIQQVAQTDATVLILGETGTGKELVARAIHRISNRQDRPMIKVNCAALPENLIESELFGHEKGAFTGAFMRKVGRFELADGATIFLDEIGELPLGLQAKLLRVLQEGEFERVGGTETLMSDVRVIAATNRKLEDQVEAGRFREDLYYRLNVFPIDNIPLRERREDIPLLIQYFVEKYSEKIGKKVTMIPQKFVDDLMKYDFPGNIRELENLVERAVVLSSGEKLMTDNILPDRKRKKDDQGILPFDAQIKKHIIDTLRYCEWKVSGPYGAAEMLKLNPKTLESKMRKYGIRRQDFMT